MKTTLGILAALACAAALAADADPRDTYSTDGLKLTWSEEFDFTGLPDTNVWRAEVGFIRNHEPQYYTDMRAENCFVSNGVLTITARREKFPNPLYKDRHLGGWYREREFAEFTSADITTRRSFLYGRLEIRACMPSSRGAWPALWMLGDALRVKDRESPEYYNWPACGEIDILEIWCNNSNVVTSCVHTSKHGHEHKKASDFHTVIGGGDLRLSAPGERPYEGFHTYTLDWYEDRLVFFYDGKKYGSCTLSRGDWPGPEFGNPFRKPHFLIMNLALGGYGNTVLDEDTVDEKSGKTHYASVFPMEMKIDYVRYYERENNAKPAAPEAKQ